ncbi:hypothetical protein HY501_01985 [Candidatus Woesearchaeota archaeon]|nr:hypothetical protein [Candidatus Woesearchaeota archaeon]
MTKKGKMEIEYIIIFVLGLLLLVFLLLYTGKAKEKALELVRGFINLLLGRS